MDNWKQVWYPNYPPELVSGKDVARDIVIGATKGVVFGLLLIGLLRWRKS